MSTLPKTFNIDLSNYGIVNNYQNQNELKLVLIECINSYFKNGVVPPFDDLLSKRDWFETPEHGFTRLKSLSCVLVEYTDSDGTKTNGLIDEKSIKFIEKDYESSFIPFKKCHINPDVIENVQKTLLGRKDRTDEDVMDVIRVFERVEGDDDGEFFYGVAVKRDCETKEIVEFTFHEYDSDTTEETIGVIRDILKISVWLTSDLSKNVYDNSRSNCQDIMDAIRNDQQINHIIIDYLEDSLECGLSVLNAYNETITHNKIRPFLNPLIGVSTKVLKWAYKKICFKSTKDTIRYMIAAYAIYKNEEFSKNVLERIEIGEKAEEELKKLEDIYWRLGQTGVKVFTIGEKILNNLVEKIKTEVILDYNLITHNE